MKEVRKILVIRFSSIGDIVLTTPVVRSLRKQYPQAQIHYLTKESYACIMRANPYVDEVITIRRKSAEVLEQLKAAQYDFVVDLHKNLRSAQVLMQLGRPFDSFNKLNKKKWLYVNFKINLLPHKHIVERYFGAVRRLGACYDGQGLDYFIPEHQEVFIGEALPGNFSDGYVVLVVGSKQKTKQMPVPLIEAVCRNLNSPVVLLGGREDAAKGAEVAETAGDDVFNGCGLFTIHQSASVIRQARLVITPDTGLMHIAAALRKRVLAVWGNTVPCFGMYPLYPEGQENFVNFEIKKLYCRPCSKLGFDECPKGHFRCMNEQDAAEICKAASVG